MREMGEGDMGMKKATGQKWYNKVKYDEKDHQKSIAINKNNKIDLN